MKKVLILGGDGYLGWPTAMYFARLGHEVAVVDNLSKRQWELECGVSPLIPLPALQNRIRTFKEATGIDIKYYIGDVTNSRFLYRTFNDFLPEAIIHYAEQPSAVYSMIDRKKAVFSQVNNIAGTLNILFAIKKYNPDCHLIKLGTMGEYGTPNIDIEEGFIEINHNGRSDVLPFPKQAGSFYHLSKVHDSNNIYFVCKIWDLRATDLNQGVVYGIETEETVLAPKLATSFHYDEVFGTALNRFCTQAVAGIPLTVYGKGGQKRGFLNILDTLQCVGLALENPPQKGEFRVMNQFTEVFSIMELAETVKRAGEKIGLKVKIESIPNPRVEAEEHYYNPKNEKFKKLGLKPHLLSDVLVNSMLQRIIGAKDNIDVNVILPTIKWKQT